MPRPEEIGGKIGADHPLFDLIEQVYRVFAYPKPHSTGVCEHCCMDPQIEADFFNPPIRELPLAYVRDWYFAACERRGASKATWGWLLPRILEILAAGDDVATVGLEVSLARFDTGNPGNWSGEEWHVLDSFQRQYLALQIEDGRDNLDDVLCMFRLGGWPMEDLLEQVAAFPDHVLARRFWRDWCEHHVPGREAVWITAFWEAPDNTTAFDFYTSPSIHARMEGLALADETYPELATQASAVVGVIEAEVNWRQ